MTSIDPDNPAFLGEEFVPAIGISLDTVGYGSKPFSQQQDVQARLPRLTGAILGDIGLQYDGLPRKMSGDGLDVFLPPATDPTRALPGLLSATAARLAEDNKRFQDRIRIRMAIGFDLITRGRGGLGGELIIAIKRLVDCPPVRQAMIDHPESDLAVVVSHELHDMVARTGSLQGAFAFSRIDVVMKSKNYNTSAWLWVGPPRQANAA
jgi:hypothetical protein